MPSPFPGMDPFIEGQVWRGFHIQLTAELQRVLGSLVPPRYDVFIEERVYIETEPSPEFFVPDAAVVRESWPGPVVGSGGTAVAEAPFTVRIVMPEEVREPYLEIRMHDSGEVVCVIEILSPTNKRPHSEGRAAYLAKRGSVLRSRAHLVEFDLLRGGQRMPMEDPLPPGDIFTILTHARRRPFADVWPVFLRKPLPVVRVPLAGADIPVSLPLQQTFDAIYDAARFAKLVKYDRKVEPPLGPEDEEWVRTRLQEWPGPPR